MHQPDSRKREKEKNVDTINIGETKGIECKCEKVQVSMHGLKQNA